MGKYYDNEITPVSTTDLEWLPDAHRYRMKLTFADKITNGVVGKSYLAACNGNEDKAIFSLDELSADMYKFIYKYNRRDINKRKADEHKLAKNGDLLDVIRDTMGDMLRAALRSGYTIDKDLSWVNPETNTVLDLSNVPSIAPDAIDGLFAYNILHKGPYSYRIDAEDYRSDY
jgi:hypothetical protein